MRRTIHLLLLTAVALVVVATPAFAADTVVPRDDTVITVPLALATVVAGIVIPIVHGLAVRFGAPAAVKVLVGLLLSAVAGLINTAVVLDGVAVFSKTAIVAAALAWVTQVATYLNVFKPLGAPEKLAPNVGIGGGPAFVGGD
jgi:hypothetical protein